MLAEVHAGGDRGQVGAGAEAATGAGDQQRAAVGIGVGRGQRRDQRLQRGVVQRIHPLRPVQDDAAPSPALRDADRFLHRFPPRFV